MENIVSFAGEQPNIDHYLPLVRHRGISKLVRVVARLRSNGGKELGSTVQDAAADKNLFIYVRLHAAD